MSKISIVVPAYNVAKYIDKCFESLLNQSFQDYEIIAINDGSTDDTLKRMKAYETEDQRIRVIDKENEGVGATRNMGLSLAKSEYVIFIDPDDYVDLKMLEILYDKAVQTNANMVVCDYYEVYEGTTEKTLMRLPIESTTVISVQNQKDLIFKITPAPWNKLIKTCVLKENGISFPLDFRSEDLVFTVTLLAKCETLAVVHEPLYFYLANRMNNVSSANDERVLHTIKALKEIFKAYEMWNIKEDFKDELDMLAIKQIQYELHKVIYITDSALATKIMNEFYEFLNSVSRTWKNNKYYHALYKEANVVNKYRYWIYESPNRLKLYYALRNLKK